MGPPEAAASLLRFYHQTRPSSELFFPSIFCSAFQEFQCINAKCSASTQNGRAQGGCRELDERSSTLLGRNMQLTSTQAAEAQPFLLCLSCEAGWFHPWGVVRETLKLDPSQGPTCPLAALQWPCLLMLLIRAAQAAATCLRPSSRVQTPHLLF